jgi:hypothetical protein
MALTDIHRAYQKSTVRIHVVLELTNPESRVALKSPSTRSIFPRGTRITSDRFSRKSGLDFMFRCGTVYRKKPSFYLKSETLIS